MMTHTVKTYNLANAPGPAQQKHVSQARSGGRQHATTSYSQMRGEVLRTRSGQALNAIVTKGQASKGT